MRHCLFSGSPEDSYKVAVLVKTMAFNGMEMTKVYADPMAALGIPKESVIAFSVDYETPKKVSNTFMKEYLAELMPVLDELKVEYLYVADANYFKVITGQQKADIHFGYVLPCKLKGYEHMHVVLGLNHQQLIYNPDLQAKLDLSLNTLASHVNGTYAAIGTGIIHSEYYPVDLEDIKAALDGLHQHSVLSCDIEAFSLRFNEAGIGTIAFAWDQHNGIAFACDYREYSAGPSEGTYGYQLANHAVRILLLNFFLSYKGEITWHNAAYDVKIIIYTLWMQGYEDTEGLLKGLECMTRSIQDTKIIAYLATNSTAGNVLGLKALAHEFAGNWAKDDIKDIRRIPLPELLKYNLVDCLSTNYVKDKYHPIMVADNQLEIYQTLMLPSLKMLLQTELTGMPMSRAKIDEIEVKLTAIDANFREVVRVHPQVTFYEEWRTQKEWVDDFEDRKAKAKNPEKIVPKDRATYPQFVFNPGSGQQLQVLLFDMLGFPVIDFTDTKQPATGEKTLAKLLDHPVGVANKDLLEALIGLSQVSTILSTFVPAFKKAIDRDGSGIVWLHGSFNIGGTVSGRLSSSEPNLQNIPANSIFGKLIKSAFVAPDGWLMCGADFNSLEDMISALTTKDSNKLKVYTDGYCGHCLRASYYFKDQLPDIDSNNVASVNSIKKLYPELRQESKTPTFALTYGGTYHTMMANLGWTKEKAQSIEANYHVMYAESDTYIQTRLKQASVDGYVEVAFGLRVRTPLLKQVVFGASKMPYEAAAEGRTAGNAMGQSYGLLNNRAAVDFMKKVWASPYRLDIKLIALIHDAIYPLIRDRIDIVEWVNRELILSMQWQKLEEIKHPTVKLGAALDVFYNGWHQPITLPNNASQPEILEVARKGKEEFNKPKPKKE